MQTQSTPNHQLGTGDKPPTAAFRWVGLLLAINTLNFFDRQVLPAVAEPLRHDWQLSDFQLGALGTAFTLLYAFAGLPLGRLADRWNRSRLLSLGVGAWSLMTAVSAAAWGFPSLFLMRLGVGVGEAACAPVATSMIADLFPAQRRARALSVFMLGLPLGLMLSYAVSGSVAQHFGWRWAFLVAGLPGLLLACLAAVMADPPRQGRPPTDTHPNGPNLWLRPLMGIRTLWWIVLSGALHNFNMYAISAFLPAFLTRIHGLDVQAAGFFTGITYGIVGGSGMLLGGWAGDRCYARRRDGRLLLTTWCTLAALPLFTLALLCPPGAVAPLAACLLPACLLLYVYYSNIYATIQDIVPAHLRGTAMALYFFAMYLLGASIGPAATGWLSDTLALRAARAVNAAVAGESQRAIGLHQAMYVVPLLGILLVLVLYLATRALRQQQSCSGTGTQVRDEP